jgi:hypothetical protein
MSAFPTMLDMPAIKRVGLDANAWPYPWVYIPPGGISFYSPGSVAAPNYGVGNQVEICEYTVPISFEGVLTKLMNQYLDPAPSTFVQGSGDIIFDYDIDRPIGAPLSTGHYLADYYHILVNQGSTEEGPWPVEGGIRLKQGETIRLKVYTVQNVLTGAPAFVHGALLGWIWPMARLGV